MADKQGSNGESGQRGGAGVQTSRVTVVGAAASRTWKLRTIQRPDAPRTYDGVVTVLAWIKVPRLAVMIGQHNIWATPPTMYQWQPHTVATSPST